MTTFSNEVAGLPANNVPSLSPHNQASGFTHQFETVLADGPQQRVYLLEDAAHVAARAAFGKTK